VSIIKGELSIDDRGTVKYFNDFNPEKEGIKRMYLVENHRVGTCRAWHGHRKEGKYVTVIVGTALIATVTLSEPVDTKEAPVRHVLSAGNPRILFIPPGYANGMMNLTDDCRILVFSTATLLESYDDDIRLPWNTWDVNIWRIKAR
jgi:dTDP-4-dehydrorhamnose 3,5-epimerase-like enzyme